MALLSGRCLVSALGGGLDGDCRAMQKFQFHENGGTLNHQVVDVI